MAHSAVARTKPIMMELLERTNAACRTEVREKVTDSWRLDRRKSRSDMVRSGPCQAGNRPRRSFALSAAVTQRPTAWFRRSISRKGSLATPSLPVRSAGSHGGLLSARLRVRIRPGSPAAGFACWLRLNMGRHLIARVARHLVVPAAI
ncbi:MAG: hypothetical protein E7813_02540 [Bradyrhizobium sp.]|nr:MAG: hypothetical protein E7813_02540 [Bradyrhizobium sp.]